VRRRTGIPFYLTVDVGSVRIELFVCLFKYANVLWEIRLAGIWGHLIIPCQSFGLGTRWEGSGIKGKSDVSWLQSF
jgi:hypothetical protein